MPRRVPWRRPGGETDPGKPPEAKGRAMRVKEEHPHQLLWYVSGAIGARERQEVDAIDRRFWCRHGDAVERDRRRGAAPLVTQDAPRRTWREAMTRSSW